eukprot:CAMPEP_0184867454 /NCGR_PEP_ID=MMETSP0580-20130426/26638_1 /TAXON_ID=1118495 /ORGANISM="Dactyliosolen fragilissimus" /LENGTH=545 /DNA_ID=CAMNT_0027367765 /DNA_START=47 /DNA_END=1681 /DNA_ORIENTATION=+
MANDKGTDDVDVDGDVTLQDAEEEGENFASGGRGSSLNSHGYYGIWGYKSLKQLVKLGLRLSDGAMTMTYYQRLLECISSPNCTGVSPNAVETGVNNMLERISSAFQLTSSTSTTTPPSPAPSSSDTSQNNLVEVDGNNNKNNSKSQMARNVYDATITIFHPRTGSCPNERLWFKTNLKYGQLLYDMHETAKLQAVIRDLLRSSHEKEQSHHNYSSNTTTNTSSSSTNLMEVYALQIQLYSRLKDNKKLRGIFSKAMQVQGGIPHPRTLALIQELGGKMHMASREFEAASKTFFQAFKSYDEAGDSARLRCLKYLVMASMLHESTINPFDSQEARAYKDNPQILAMTNLVQAFHNGEIQRFEQILQRNRKHIMDDEFIREYIDDLLRTIRIQVLQNVIRPYTRIKLTAIARELNNIPVEDVENLLVSLILDNKLNGQIDAETGVLHKHLEINTTPQLGTNSESSSTAAGNGGTTTTAASGMTSSNDRSMTMGRSNLSSSYRKYDHDNDDTIYEDSIFTTTQNLISEESKFCDSIDEITIALQRIT